MEAVIEALIKATKQKAVKTELYLISAFFGSIALLFFSMAGWHFLAELKSAVFASLILACVFFVLSSFCVLIIIVKTHHQHNKHQPSRTSNKHNPETIHAAGIGIVEAFFSGLNAGRGKSNTP